MISAEIAEIEFTAFRLLHANVIQKLEIFLPQDSERELGKSFLA
jgi:hypothetical protein